MPKPAKVPINIYHGDTLSFTVGIAEDVDVTGHTPLFQIKNAGVLIKDWSAYVTITGPQLITVNVPGDPDTNGTFGLPRPSATATYDYDIQLTAPSTGSVRTIMRGKAIVTGDVSYG